MAYWGYQKIADYFDVSRSTAVRLTQCGTFPACTRLPSPNGQGHPRWVDEEVMEWARSYRGREVAL